MTVRYHQPRRRRASRSTSCHGTAIQSGACDLPRRAWRRHRRRPSPSCCSTPSPPSPWKSPSPCRPSSKPAPTTPTRCGAATSSGPATTPSWPDGATSASTPTTASSPTPSRPTGTTPYASSPTPKTTTSGPATPPKPAHDEHKSSIRALATDFPALWADPATPQRERKRMARLLIEDVTLNKTDAVHLHVRFRGGQTTSLSVPLPLSAAQLRRPDKPSPDATSYSRLTPMPRSPSCSTKRPPHRHRRPFSARNVLHLRRDHQLPSHQDRLRQQGLLSLTEIAEQLGVHPGTIKSWHAAALIIGHRANDKNEHLYEPPTAWRPTPRRQLGAARRTSSIEPTPGGAV